MSVEPITEHPCLPHLELTGLPIVSHFDYLVPPSCYLWYEVLGWSAAHTR